MNSYSPRIVRSPPSQRLSHSQHAVSPLSNHLTQSTISAATTSRFKDPQALLLQRWQRVTAELAARRLSRKSVVALNRALDEAEDLIARDESRANRDISQLNPGLGIADDMFMQKMDVGQAMTPPNSTILYAPEGLEMERKEIRRIKHTEPVLERVESLVKELRKRQEDFRVCCNFPWRASSDNADVIPQYLHSIVIAKAEEGAETIMQLESDRENL